MWYNKDMTGVLGIAVSALQAQLQRVAVSSHNIVNARTEGYQPLQTSLITRDPNVGGVLAAVSPVIRQPSSMTAVQQNETSLPEVDIAAEFVTQIQSRVAYAAALKTIEAEDENFEALLNIKA